VKTAFGLAHIGEFSFILLKAAQTFSIFNADINQTLLTAAILSMFSVPLALKLGRRLSGFRILSKGIIEPAGDEPLTRHTILAGFGITGQNIARILKLLNIPYSVIEMNPSTVKKYKLAGEPIVYGTIDRRENLLGVGITRASLLVVAINDREAARRTVTIARQLNPAIKIIVRVNFLAQVEDLYALGADLVLSQDMETSLSFIQHILKFYKMPDHVSRIQTNMLRKEHYRFFLKKELREAWKIAILDAVEQDNEMFFISPHSKHAGKKLSELAPLHFEDMEIIGVIRQNQILSENLQDLVLQGLDTIIFSGIHASVYAALTWMEKNN
jgi:CPA2 family monovalent cation:H+ antiporter-2